MHLYLLYDSSVLTKEVLKSVNVFLMNEVMRKHDLLSESSCRRLSICETSQAYITEIKTDKIGGSGTE